jgi:hypothetical protein
MRKTMRYWFDIKFPKFNKFTYEIRPKGRKWIAVRGDKFLTMISNNSLYWSMSASNAYGFDTAAEAKENIMRSIWHKGYEIKEETREKEIEKSRSKIVIPPWNAE